MLPRLNEIVGAKDLMAATNALEVMRAICTSDSVLALCKAADPETQRCAALRLVAASGIPSSISKTTMNDAQATVVVRAMKQAIQSESAWMAATYDFQSLFALATSKTVPAPVQKEARKAQVDAIKSLTDRVGKGGDDAALVHALWRSLGVVLQQQVALTPPTELAVMNKALPCPRQGRRDGRGATQGRRRNRQRLPRSGLPRGQPAHDPGPDPRPIPRKLKPDAARTRALCPARPDGGWGCGA
jgi:hypothetical protein